MIFFYVNEKENGNKVKENKLKENEMKLKTLCLSAFDLLQIVNCSFFE